MKNTIKYAFALLTVVLGMPYVSAEVTLKNASGKKLETILLMSKDLSKRVRNLGYNREKPVEKNAIVKFAINPQENPFVISIIDDRGEAINIPNITIDGDANIELITTPGHKAILEVKTGKEVKQYKQKWQLEKTKEEFTFENRTNKTIGRIAVSSGFKEYNVHGWNNPLKAGEHESFRLPIGFDFNKLTVLVVAEGEPAIFKNIKVSEISKVLTLTEDAQGKLHLDVHEVGK